MPMNAHWIAHTRTAAAVDRIVILLQTPRPVSHTALASLIPRATTRTREGHPRWYLKRVDNDPLLYRLTVQDPPSVPSMLMILDRLKRRCPLAAPPRVGLLEVAVDTYPLEGETLNMERITADLFKGAKFSPSNNIRAAGALRGSGMNLMERDAAYRALKSGRTLYQGDRTESHAIRWYVKTTDDRGRYELPAAEHRCRHEIEYRDAGLPATTLEGLDGFRYESLSKHFLAWTLADGLAGLPLLVADRRSKLGRTARRTRRRREFSEQSLSVHNKRVYSALRLLSERMASASRAAPLHPRAARSRDQARSVSHDSFFAPS